jgi:hypothetical protein
LDHWITGSLDHWITRSLDHWITGSLDHWITGSLDHWITGSLDHWITGSLDHWITGSLFKIDLLLHLKCVPGLAFCCYSIILRKIEKTVKHKIGRSAELPDFCWYLIPKPEKFTKSTQNVPNAHKISQMTLKIPNGRKIYQHFPI